MSSSGSKKERKAAKPAFDGAAFDKDGYCLRHKSVQLAEQAKQDGRVLWQELKMNCPKCVSEHHKSRRVTSLGGAGKVKRGRTVHGMSNPLRSPSKQGRHMDKEFDTPFDDKGRCHHHPNVQMATKKARGGWKILVTACPKCIEANYEEESVDSRASSRASSRGRSRNRYDDGESVGSRSTKLSVASRTKAVTSSGKFDKNGCCTRHPTVQVAKKKLLGGWKEFRSCPKCIDPNYDDVSVGSRSSRRSATSFRSTGTAKSGRSRKSAKSNSSRKGGRKTDRYGALPFDEEGYCHAHPGVRLAKKKALGGWKVLHDICPDCAHDAHSNAGSSRASSRKSRGTGRVYDDSGSDASSYKSGRSTGSRKKKIRVKDMRYRDEHGKEGRYSGDVDEDHSPHGQGKMKYRDGSVFSGVWSEGSQVHGKTNKAKSSSGGSKSKGSGGKNGSNADWARVKDDGASTTLTVPAGNRSRGGKGGGGGNKTVRKMKWMDYYGDPGEYTGKVDSSDMPDGKGSMKYDHGLIQEGMWTKGQFVEGSDMSNTSLEGKKSGGRSGEGRKKSGGDRSGGERSGRKHSSSRNSSRKLDP